MHPLLDDRIIRMIERRAIILDEWNPLWPVLAEREAAAIAAALGPLVVAIEHIGSTAVPGLAAKPIVDLMVAIRDLRDSLIAIPAMQSLGYEYVPQFEASLPARRYFRKDTVGVRTHHVHMVEIGGEFWRDHIAFRGALRADPQLAAAYANLKRSLARRFVDDTAGYTAAKSDFIREVIAHALAKSKASNAPDSR